MQQSLIPKKKIEHYTYLMHDQIGKGYSSRVYKGKDELTGETVAVKVIDMKAITNDVEKQLVHQEINALKLIQSVNVLKLYDYYHTNNNTYIITEHCNHGDLANLITQQGSISEVEALKILRHIINGFKEQIKKGVIHRDIKPSNILIKNSIPKIADYGFSKMLKSKDKVYYRVGTPMYMSPESFLENKYSEKSDIWSIGVLYYELLYGQCPWVINKESEFQDCTSQLHFSRNVAVSEESKDFLRRALDVDENQRIGLAEIDQHPLFCRRNTTNLKQQRSPLVSNSFNKSITNLNLVRVNQTQQCNARSGSSNKPLTSPDRKETQKHQHQRSLKLERLGLIVQHQNQSFHYDSTNEELIANQMNLCKFLYRTCQLIEHIYQGKWKIRQISNISKEAMDVLWKIKECYDKGVNTLRLINYNHMQTMGIFNKLQFRETYGKQKEYFQKYSDCGDSCLSEVIRELNHNLRLKEPSEAAILLLDYLVYYYQVNEMKLVCQFQDGKPMDIQQTHYQELRIKIFNLGI